VWKTKSKLEEGVMLARVAQWELTPLMVVSLRSQEHQPMNQVRIPYLLLHGLCVLHDLRQLNTPHVVHHDCEW